MISVVASTIRVNMLPRVIENFTRQTFPEKELIIIVNKNKVLLPTITEPSIRVFHLDEAKTLGECLNFGFEQARGEFLAKMDDDDYYSPHYLINSLRQLKETSASVVGKAAIYVYFKEDKRLSLFRPRMNHCFLKNKRAFLAGGTLVFKSEVLEKARFRKLNTGEDVQFQQDCLDQKLSLFSGSFQDYVLIRYEEGHHHSWQQETKAFQKQCKTIAVTESFEDFVWQGGGAS